MDHRQQPSEASAYSLADSIKSLAARTQGFTSLAFISDSELKKLDAQKLLSRMLSTRSAISTASTLARESQEAAENLELRKYIHIGQGQCGTVFGFRGTNEVIKTPNGPTKEEVLYIDAQAHARVDKAFRDAPTQLRTDISVPRYIAWIKPDMQTWWSSRLSLFPTEYRTPTYGLVSERIFPLPAPVRAAIIDTYCPTKLKAAALENPANKDCLVRLYLGKREPGKREQEQSFRLRNFPLLINELEDLKIDPLFFSRVMADALAILHWSANVDGNDVKFVLGSAPAETFYRNAVGPEELQLIGKDAAAHAGADFDFTKQAIHVWLLDFNQCTKFNDGDFGDTELKLLTTAFWFNDPYFPRPVSDHPADKALWVDFVDRYLWASQHLTNSAAPAQFIKTIEDEGARRREKVASQGKGSLFGALAG